MPNFETDKLRNVVLVGHTGVGKTSLSDSLAFASGTTTRQGMVDEKTSLSDYEPEEQERGSSVQLSLVPCTWKAHGINLLDTPGYSDFKGDMISAMSVADSMIAVVSATSGIQVGTSYAWALSKEFVKSRFVVINKVDGENVDFNDICGQIKESWGRECVPITIPDISSGEFQGVVNILQNPDVDTETYEYLIELVAESDEELMEKYLEEGSLTEEEILKGLKNNVISGDIVPVFATAATTGVGVPELLDAITSLFPSPEEIDSKNIPEDSHVNYIFKTSADPYVGKISYFRVFGKPLSSNMQLVNNSVNETEKIGQLYSPCGKDNEPVETLPTGSIGVITKLAHSNTFDTLCNQGNDFSLPKTELPTPIYSVAVSPATQADLDKMTDSISRIVAEDPTLILDRNNDTGQTILRGMGEIHIKLAMDRVKRKFEVSLKTSLPKISYRETIMGQATVDYKHKKQSGGSGQYGHVVMKISPSKPGGGINFSSKVVGGNVPREYIPAVEKGVRNVASGGILAGFPVVDVDVVLMDGSSHSVDSSGMAFEIAGSMGFREGVRDAKPVLLEPITKISVLIPDDSVGDVTSDLNQRRGRITGMLPQGIGLTSITAEIPESAIQTYAVDLRSITQDRGDFSYIFDHYDPVPPNDTANIIAKVGKE